MARTFQAYKDKRPSETIALEGAFIYMEAVL